MSLINQMLQDLEKRRASSSERGALPDQVRVLPPVQKSGVQWWLLGAGGVVVLLAALAWQHRVPQPPPVPTTQTGEPPAAAAVVAAPASRLALDLEKIPSADSKSRSVSGREVAPKPAQSADKSPGRPAPDRAAQPQPPVPATAVIAAAPQAEASKTTGGSSETVTVMKAVPVTPAAPPSSAPVASAKPVAGVAAPAPQSALNAKPAVPAPAPPPAAKSDDSKAQAALANPQIDKRSQQLTTQQLAENEYRDAANFLNQGRLAEAQEGFRLALQQNPAHVGARQGLFGLLVDAKKNGEAEQLLQDGLKLNPNQPNFAILLSNLQFERGDATSAIETLQKTAPAAQNSPDYLARLAGLLQRQSRHPEAVAQYQAALRLAPGSGVWWMGLGISLQAINRNAEAQDAFRRAKAANTLNPELQAFVDQRLKQLQ